MNAKWHLLSKSLNKHFCDEEIDNNPDAVFLSGIIEPDGGNGCFLSSRVDPRVREMFGQMYHVRKAYETAAPNAMRSEIDGLTMHVARMNINKYKREYYLGLWRKWRLSWTTVSRWAQATGESQGAIYMPVGLSLIHI